MTLPGGGKPVKIGSRQALLTFWGMPRNPGDPKRVEGTFTLNGPEGDLVLDVFEGPQGEPGENAPIMRWEYDSTITEVGDLPDVATLDETDDGRAWLIGTTWYIYVDAAGTDGEYKAIDSGIPGIQGPVPDVGASAEFRVTTDPDDADIDVVESGASDEPHFRFKFPSEFLRGPVGPSTNIRLAPDYDNSDPPLDGQGVVWDETLGKFRPGDLSPFAAKMYTIPHANFVDYTGSATRQLIGSLDIEAQDIAYYIDVSGHLRIQRGGLLASVQVEVEVRIGDTGVGTGETADLCGLGPYDPSWALFDSFNVAHLSAHFSDIGNPIRAIAPDSADGRIPAGQAKTVYVFLHKLGGSGNYTFAASPTNQVRLLLLPVS